ncbi:ADP-ribosylglycohydrolase family protein [Oxynema aestuarii]|uniref:ADP-ribosylglycohydrolase family protein n=1 Tax=Oxynema aestuarii AP17 TaxID=2064643 RepID=A0A6H1U0S4_9CYAN|nr:ADP-ribosylglycohydrolase family protein [Oxynema aestuarii]QIZ72462.1 ADP-ribosylglycohydrolase family protein [Oxynema aestuarii AP17]
MHYSLLGHFEGTLLAARFGEQLARTGGSCARQHFSEMAVATTRHLIREGGLNLESWEREIASFDRPPSSLAIASFVPLSLYFHEDDLLLNRALYHIIDILSIPPTIASGLAGVARAIARGLREPLDLDRELGDPFGDGDDGDGAIAAGFEGVVAASRKGASWESCQRQMSGWPALPTSEENRVLRAIARAWFCFCSTPQDLRLSLLRAARSPQDPVLTAFIAGSLSGAYNGSEGIPLGWQRPGDPLGGDGFLDLKSCARELLEAWSGVYDLQQTPKTAGAFLAVAPPKGLRPR